MPRPWRASSSRCPANISRSFKSRGRAVTKQTVCFVTGGCRVHAGTPIHPCTTVGTFAQEWASKLMAMGGVLKSLEDLWAQGQMRDLEHDLDRFIRDNLGEIR